MTTTENGRFDFIGTFETGAGAPYKWVRLWRCVQCGGIRATENNDPEPDECACCERWDRRWEA